MKIPHQGPGALQAFKEAHQAAGAHGHTVREKAHSFYQDFAYGDAFKEIKLKLRLAIDPSSKQAMSTLWDLLFQHQGPEGARIDKLQSWMSDNKGLVGWMSSGTQAMLADIASGGAQAVIVDKAVRRAEDAITAAFGSKASSPEAQKALESVRFEARIDGAVQVGFAFDIDRMASKVSSLFHPGAKQALGELKSMLARPDVTDTQRRDFFYGWMQKNQRLTNALDPGIIGRMRHDISVADWSDNRAAAADKALQDAFAGKSAA